MGHRCRTCGEAHFHSTAAISFPLPDKLARIDSVMPELLEAAREFESFGEGSPVEFCEWLAITARRSALANAGIRHPIK